MADKDVLKEIALDLIEKKIITEDLKILLGLSGGPDSIFCLNVLLKVKDIIPIELSCAHVNYNLRGRDSTLDMEFSQDICKKNKIKLFIKEVQIKERQGIQETARNIRLKFFKEIMEENKIDRLALAHNRDDNIETVLFNIIRGTGINGITGIEDNIILRPIINIEKSFINEYLKKNSIDYREDVTNKKTIYTRNAIRHILIPEMKKINPSLYNAIENLTCSAREHRKIAEDMFEDMFYKYKIVVEKQQFFIFDLAIFSESIESLNIFFELFFKRRLGIKEGIYRNSIIELLELKDKSSCKERELKGYLFFTDYDRLFIVKKDRFDIYFPDFPEIKIERPVDNKYIRFNELNDVEVSDDGDVFIDVRESDLNFPLVLRHRKNGDRISGKKLLKKIFIDKKINRIFRERIPVLEDAQGKILWVPGVYNRKYNKADKRLLYIGRKFWIKK